MKQLTFQEAFEAQLERAKVMTEGEMDDVVKGRKCRLSDTYFKPGEVPVFLLAPAPEEDEGMDYHLIIAKKTVVEKKDWKYHLDDKCNVPRVVLA